MLVTGNAKTTVLKGTTFADMLIGYGVMAYADGSASEDSSKVAHESMFGNSGNDKLYGGAGNDKLYGEVGNDILNGGSGNDFLDGGSGTDTAIFKNSISSGNGWNNTEAFLVRISPDPVSFNWVNGKLTVTSNEGVDTLVNIENLKFGGQTFKISDVVIAQNDEIVGGEKMLDVAASTLLANDFSAKAGGPSLYIQTDWNGYVGQTTEGASIYLDGDGKLQFAPGESAYRYLEEGETAVTHFSYTIGNGTGLTDTADVALTIMGADNTKMFGTSGQDIFAFLEGDSTEADMVSIINFSVTDEVDKIDFTGMPNISPGHWVGVNNGGSGFADYAAIKAAAIGSIWGDWFPYIGSDGTDTWVFIDNGHNSSLDPEDTVIKLVGITADGIDLDNFVDWGWT